MHKIMLPLSRLLKDRSGAAAIEYGLLAALVSVGIIVALGGVGDGITAMFTDVCTEISTQVPDADVTCTG